MLMTKGRISVECSHLAVFTWVIIWEHWRIGVRLQHEYECFFSIVDLHALTSSYSDTSKLQENVMEMAIDWLKCWS